jgi:hypothetical protein
MSIDFKIPKDFSLQKIKEEADKHSAEQQVQYFEYLLKELELQYLENPIELVDHIVKGLKIQYMNSINSSKAKEIHESIKLIGNYKNHVPEIHEKKKSQLEIELSWRKKQLESPDKILWEKKKQDLPIFFDFLIHTLKIFSEETSDEQITKHFMWRNQKTGKPEAITLEVLSEIRETLKNIAFENGEYKFVEDFISELKEKLPF